MIGGHRQLMMTGFILRGSIARFSATIVVLALLFGGQGAQDGNAGGLQEFAAFEYQATPLGDFICLEPGAVASARIERTDNEGELEYRLEMALREPGEMARVWKARRVAVWIGLTSMGGSFCWFVAFTVQNAAYVKALGQVELILSVAASTLFFHEKISLREWAGISVLVGSIVMLVLVT